MNTLAETDAGQTSTVEDTRRTESSEWWSTENEQKDVSCEITGLRMYFHTSPFEGQHIAVNSTS